MGIIKKHVIFLLICTLSSIAVGNDNTMRKQILNEFTAAYSTFIEKRSKNSNMLPISILVPTIHKAVAYALDENNNFDLLHECIEHIYMDDKDKCVLWLISNELFSQINKSTATNDKKYQEVVYFLIKYRIQEELIRILRYFYTEKYYNERTKKLLKESILTSSLKQGRCLFLLDAANMYSDKEVMTFLQKEAYQCHKWDKSTKWVSLLLLSKQGDKKSIEKLVEIVNTPFPLENDRNNQVFCMPLELAIIPNEKVTTLLRQFLYSKEEYRESYHIYSLGRISEEALMISIEGFPAEKKGAPSIYPEQWLKPKEVEKYIKWLDSNKPYRYKSISSFPNEIKDIIFQ